jgi:4-amino-4-deoxy-L-arabinose transferase-like glycosyltransferase
VTAVGVVVLQTLACLGLGTAVLGLFRVANTLGRGERLTWAFAIGFGVLGWPTFFLGIAGRFSTAPMLILLVVGACGTVLLRRSPAPAGPQDPAPSMGAIDYALMAALAIALGFGLLEALAPPSDGDTLAYHFALPKQFLEAGRLEFVPRATDGAVPLLMHMTYVPVLGLGGEPALTLWTMVSGWTATAMVYTMTRRHLDRRWSLAAALLFLTAPAVVYGSGSGQVEVRNALFVMVAALAVAQAIHTGLLRYAAVAGLAVGFYMAAKYTGLFFAAACGLTVLLQRRWFAHGAVLTACALVAGTQWYAWNWVHTGDPVFPLLFDLLDYKDGSFWDAAHHQSFLRIMFDSERAVPGNPFWLLAYPFVATVAGYPVFESGRTGLGPFVLLILPFALAALWRFRRRLALSPLWPVALIVLMFYLLWFFAGSSQRIRHLLPLYPLLLAGALIAAHRWAAATASLRPLAAAVLATVSLQLAGHGVFALNFARHVFSAESRDAFLSRTVWNYAPVPWINANLDPSDRVLQFDRQLNYLFQVPVFYAHVTLDARVDVLPGADDPGRFLSQLRRQGVTHLLVSVAGAESGPARGPLLWRALVEKGCAEPVRDFTTRTIGSRTLAAAATGEGRMRLIRLTGAPCSR